MIDQLFQAMVVSEEPGEVFTREIREKHLSELPDYDVLIDVRYSSLNYKDALSASGNKGVTRRYPHTPGVDVAGVVAESRSDKFKPGDQVIVTGYDLGTKIPGGFGQFIRVPAEWIVPLPPAMTLFQGMIYGTAGFTAAQSVLKIIDHGVNPADGKILVSGATGGVGSISVAILAKLGYQVAAVTGKSEEQPLLKTLGASQILSRQEATDTTGRMLLREKWAAVIDTVGGDILATAIKTTRYGGIVTCCGNVASPALNISVYPFILRGVTLSGIDSASCSYATRQRIWSKLASEWQIDQLQKLATIVDLPNLSQEIDKMLKGKTKGRIVVRLKNTLTSKICS
ncbi:MAG: YhdH/YhfP family quinone oxidoreductase [Deltaproteobacteria bacterium]|nr:YhdH/YhfP family quinone oxidoreductase [Deltaproteobacteria bacterium]